MAPVRKTTTTGSQNLSETITPDRAATISIKTPVAAPSPAGTPVIAEAPREQVARAAAATIQTGPTKHQAATPAETGDTDRRSTQAPRHETKE